MKMFDLHGYGLTASTYDQDLTVSNLNKYKMSRASYYISDETEIEQLPNDYHNAMRMEYERLIARNTYLNQKLIELEQESKEYKYKYKKLKRKFKLFLNATSILNIDIKKMKNVVSDLVKAKKAKKEFNELFDYSVDDIFKI
jgi:transcription initiation factor TFIID subunit TAF12